MGLVWQILVVGLTIAVGGLTFLLLGLMRRVEVLSWQLKHIQTITPKRKGREGLKPGTKAPDFTLPAVHGGEVSLHDYAGQKVLLVFTQDGCGPCHAVLPELNRPFREKVQVLAVNNGVRENMESFLKKHPLNYSVLLQQALSVSKRYEVLATPFAFVINEEGRVCAAGVVSNHEHATFLLDAAHQWEQESHALHEVEKEVREDPSTEVLSEAVAAD